MIKLTAALLLLHFFRYDGARLMVVKGTKNLKHCALLDVKTPNPDQLDPWEDDVSAQG
jgi:hypothetical protein